jgi:cyclopropane fatty-acyl-phospholipid synthase-like methyltransferase
MTLTDTRAEYFQIRDRCRQGLLKYLAEAFDLVPEGGDREILDLGSGTGVPTMWVAEHLQGNIVALDSDCDALEWLELKCMKAGLSERIVTLCSSFNDHDFGERQFDIIIAEGFFNVIGFHDGFSRVIRLLKPGGYMIIHDDSSDQEAKKNLFDRNGCKLLRLKLLDEKVWWNDYYSRLETEINSPGNSHLRSYFHGDIAEIELYKNDPSQFMSVYYLVRKGI